MTPPAWGVHAALGAGRIAACCLVVGLVFLAIEGSLAVDVSGGQENKVCHCFPIYLP